MAITVQELSWRKPADDDLSIDTIEGVVVTGDQRGRLLGFPTANLALPDDDANLRDGVYGGSVICDDGQIHLAAISVGRRPTFFAERGLRLLEAHLLDFAGDLYDRTITVELTMKVREQTRFDSVDELVAQLGRDVETVRRHLS